MLQDKPESFSDEDPVEGRGAMTIAVGAVFVFALTVLYILVMSR